MDNNITFYCKFCTTLSNSFKSHVMHQREHRHLSKLLPCGIGRCKFFFKTESGLRSHVFRSHNVVVSQFKKCVPGNSHGLINQDAKYCCSLSFCGQEFFNQRLLMSHLRHHIKGGVSVPCPYKLCDKDFTSCHSMTGHVSRFHRQHLIEQKSNFEDSTKSQTIEIENAEVVNCTEEVDKHEFINTSLIALAQFYLKLESKYLVPESTVQYVADELRVLLSENSSCILDGVKKALHEADIPESNICHVTKCIEENCDLLKHCNELRSIYKRRAFYKSHFSYVEPQEEPLGSPGKFFYYVPIAETVKALFTNKSLNFNFYDSPSFKNGFYNDFTDGTAFKQNQFFTDNPSALKLILYQDAFELVCPIGAAKNRNHKLLAVYMAIGNLPPHERFQMEAIQLVALCKEKDFSHDLVYGKIVNDILQIQEKGIDVPVIGNIKAGLAFISGDNLGSHSLGGFNENFSKSEFFCRYCLVQRKLFNKDGGEVRHYLPRTVKSYNNALDKLTSNTRKEVKSIEGVKFNSIFNKVKGFHVCLPGLPPCLGHDLHEGVIAKDLMLFIKHFIKKGWFTLRELNQMIDTFPYSTEDRRDKPPPIPSDAKRVTGGAWQVWTLLRLFPLILCDSIKNPHDPVWMSVLNLIQITEIAHAPSIHNSHLPYFQYLINDYLISRRELFDAPLLPKHHYLSHYPELVLQFGPLMKVWTLRFESKHTFFKRSWRATRNSKNILYTLSQKHELYQCLVRSGGCVKSDVEVGDRNPFAQILYSDVVLQAVTRKLSLSNLEEVNQVHMKGTLYKKGYVVILNQSFFQDKLDIGIIHLIVIDSSENIYFIVRKATAKLHYRMHAYCLKTSGDFECIDSKNLIAYYPCSPYTLGSFTYIRLKHALVQTVMES